MILKQRLWIVLLFGLGVGILVVLASGLSGIEFLPGRPFFLSAEEQTLPLEELSFKSWNLVGLWKTFGLILLWVIFPLSIIYFIVSPEVRKVVIRRAVTMGLTAYAFFLLLKQCSDFEPLDMSNSSLAGTTLEGENPLSANFSPETAQIFTWIANVVFIALLALLIWYAIRWWSKRTSTLEELSAQASKVLDDIQAGEDLKDTVLRCYAEMSRILRQNRGISRDKGMTPRQFEDELKRYGLPGDEVRQLTRLFEMARYGDIVLGEQEQRKALACLEAIVHASMGNK